MGFNVQAVSSTVAIVGGVSFDGQVQKVCAGSQAGSGTTTIGTVPADKTWKIRGIWIAGLAGTSGQVQVSGNGVVLAQAVCGVTTSGSINGYMYAPAGDQIGATLTATQTVTVTSVAGVTGYGTVYYVEEDA